MRAPVARLASTLAAVVLACIAAPAAAAQDSAEARRARGVYRWPDWERTSLSASARCYAYAPETRDAREWWQWLVLDTTIVEPRNADEPDARRLALQLGGSGHGQRVFRTAWVATRHDSIEVLMYGTVPGYTLAVTREGLSGRAWLRSDVLTLREDGTLEDNATRWRARLRRLPCAQLPRVHYITFAGVPEASPPRAATPSDTGVAPSLDEAARWIAQELPKHAIHSYRLRWRNDHSATRTSQTIVLRVDTAELVGCVLELRLSQFSHVVHSGEPPGSQDSRRIVVTVPLGDLELHSIRVVAATPPDQAMRVGDELHVGMRTREEKGWTVRSRDIGGERYEMELDGTGIPVASRGGGTRVATMLRHAARSCGAR